MIQLRDYQQRTIDDLRAAYAAGRRAPVAVLPTGAGKTVIAAEIMRNAVERGTRTLFLAHRAELLLQTVHKLSAVGIEGVRVIQASNDLGDPNAPIVVASIPTLVGRDQLPEADLVVFDECFPAGTLVDGRPIETIQVGDLVRSFNHETKHVESRRVRRLFVSRPHSLVTIHLSDGRKIRCTAGHPFFDGTNYTPAARLAPGAPVYGAQESIEIVRELRRELPLSNGYRNTDLFGCVQGRSSRGEKKKNLDAMRGMRRYGDDGGSSAVHESAQSTVLLDNLFEGICSSSQRSVDGCNESAISISANEGFESNATCGYAPQSQQGAEGNRSSTENPRREWAWPRSDGDKVAQRITTGLGAAAVGLYGDARERCSDGLQARHRESGYQDRNRSGRIEPLHAQGSGSGRSEAGVSRVAWVDRVEIHEPASSIGFGQLCPNDLVYNLEVDGNHNYFVNDVLVHNCHHAVAQSWRRIADHYASARLLGLTATPERSDGKPLGDLFDALIVGPSIRQLTELGHLVPCEVYAPPGKLETGEIAVDIVAAYRRHTDGLRAVVFCGTVAVAEQYVDELRVAGVAAAVVSGRRSRSDTMAAFARGELRVICNVHVLCLDDQTEILTSHGWVGMHEMTNDHLVANWADGNVCFEKPLDVVRRPRGEFENMVSLNSPRMSIRVTATHRMLYRTLPGGLFRKCPAHELVGRHVELPISGQAAPLAMDVPREVVHARGRSRAISSATYNLIHREGYERDAARAEAERRVDRRAAQQTKAPADLTLDECRLIGFWLGDGSVIKIRRGGVEYTLTQSKAYPKIIAWIDALLERLGIHAVRRDKTNTVPHVCWSMPRGTGGGSQERVGVRPIEPYLDKNGSPLLRGLDEARFDAFVEGFWMADGLHGDGTPLSPRRSMRLHNTNVTMLSRIQAIAVVRGYGAHLIRGGKPAKAHHKQLWHLVLRKKESFHLGTFRFVEETVWAPEMVWCVRTRTKNIITRRNGSVVVIGNTEGWDDPGVEAIILARKPGHVGTYLQIAGRGLRPAPGKARALLIDLCGAVHEHGTPDADREYSLDGRAISSTDDREPIRQCPTCGAVFRAVEVEAGCCPKCGVELPRKPVEAPTAIGAELQAIGSKAAPAPSRTFTIAARFESWCAVCRAPIHVGDSIAWARGAKPKHTRCADRAAMNAADALLRSA